MDSKVQRLSYQTSTPKKRLQKNAKNAKQTNILGFSVWASSDRPRAASYSGVVAAHITKCAVQGGSSGIVALGTRYSTISATWSCLWPFDLGGRASSCCTDPLTTHTLLYFVKTNLNISLKLCQHKHKPFFSSLRNHT